MEQIEKAIPDGFLGEKAIVTPYNIREYQAGNSITKQIYITHIGYYPNAKYHYIERKKGTSEYIFIYCEKGKGWIEYGDEKYTLSENSFFILPPNEKHSYGADFKNPWSLYWFHFKGENVVMFKSILAKLIKIDNSNESRYLDRIQLFNEMYQNLEMGYSPENLEYISFCLLHFLASLKYISQYREIKKLKENDIIQNVIIYMKENLENRLTVNQLAEAMNYSCSHLNTIFSERTSFSLIEYYNQLKIQSACSYLQFSELRIKEISFRLGYYDPFHFSNAFKKEMEITPSEYRKRYKFVKGSQPNLSSEAIGR